MHSLLEEVVLIWLPMDTRVHSKCLHANSGQNIENVFIKSPFTISVHQALHKQCKRHQIKKKIK